MGSVEKSEGNGKLDRRSNAESAANANEITSDSSLEKNASLDQLADDSAVANDFDNGQDEEMNEENGVELDSDQNSKENADEGADHAQEGDLADEERAEDSGVDQAKNSQKSNNDENSQQSQNDQKLNIKKESGDDQPKEETAVKSSAENGTECPKTPPVEYGEDGRKIIYVPETEVPDDECGFPAFLRPYVLRGKAIPINKKTWTDIDIDGNDSILDCASQVVPLMIKKPNIFPPKFETVEAKDVAAKNAEKETEESKEDVNKEKTEENASSGDNKEEKSESNENKKEDDESKQAQQNKATMLTISDFYKSNIGNFLVGIGLSRSKEWFHRDAIKQTQRLIRKEGELDEHTEELRKQNKLYSECKTANAIFTFKMNKCHMCEFKSESQAVMDGHYAIPHVTNRKEYKCNYCLFLTRDARTIVYHFQTQHRKPCNIQIPPHLYECPTCNYESNQKAKALAHMAKCTKIFNEEKVQATVDPENEYPAITPKPITQEDIKMYEATLQALRPAILNPRMAVPYVPGLPRGLQNQIVTMHQNQVQQQRQKMGPKAFQQANRQSPAAVAAAAAVASQPNVAAALRTLQSGALSGLVNPQTAAALAAATSNGSNLLSNLNFAKNAAPQLYHMLQSGVHAQLVPIQQKILNQAAAAGATPQQLQQLKNRLPNPTTSNSTSSSVQSHNSTNNSASKSQQLVKKSPGIVSMPNHSSKAAATNQNSSSSREAATNGGKAGTFVICEICDGYIRDLEQLRTHMQWSHKVKIHHKMLQSRPPLNCQKCQWRFFTDQGLERHLLGAHGLVTSNMQDMADQKQDGGRCTICGRVFANQLVAHMNTVHKITLRPAHLSYKCTVCSATFNLYRLFENHVYMVHSGSVKRSSDEPSSQINKKSKNALELKNSINGQEKSISSAV